MLHQIRWCSSFQCPSIFISTKTHCFESKFNELIQLQSPTVVKTRNSKGVKCHQIQLRNNHPPDLNNSTGALCLALSLLVDKWWISQEKAECSSMYRSWRYQQVWNSQFDESIEVQASWLVNNHQTDLFRLTELILLQYSSSTVEHLNRLRLTW